MIDLWIDHKGIIHASESSSETLCEKSLGDMGLAMHSIKPTCSHCLYVLDVRKVRAEMAADIAKAKSEGGDAFDPLPSPLLQKGEGIEKIVLSKADSEMFINALENPPVANEALKKASLKYKEMLEHPLQERYFAGDTDLLEPYRIGRGLMEKSKPRSLEEIEQELTEVEQGIGDVQAKLDAIRGNHKGLPQQELSNSLKVKIPKRYKDMKDLRTNLRALFQLMTDELEVGREVKVDLGGFEYGISLDPSLAKREEKAAG
jgi:hypothetical protein